MPAKAGIQSYLKTLDSRPSLRWGRLFAGMTPKDVLRLFTKPSNIERPTSNNEFCQFKKRLCKAKPPFEILRFACFKIDKAQRHQYSTFDVGRSMFDVQSVRYSGQAEFHTRGFWVNVKSEPLIREL